MIRAQASLAVSQEGAILPPREHLIMAGDVFGCHSSWHLLGRGMALNTLQCTGQPQPHGIIQPKRLVVLRLVLPDISLILRLPLCLASKCTGKR